MLPAQSIRNLRETLLQVDPGFTNLITALRGTVGVVISFFILSTLASRFQQPPMLAFLGVILAMNASIFVRDPEKRQQQITMLAVPIPACLALAISISLTDFPEAQVAGLLIVIFFAVAARRLGNRWVGLGIITFMSYFLPIFIRVPKDSLVFATASIFIAILCSYVVRFFLLPDRPEFTLKSYLECFELRKKKVIRELETVLQSPEVDREDVDAAFVALTDLSLAIEEFLKSAGSRTFKSEAETLQMRIFERELALKQLASEVEELLLAHTDKGARLAIFESRLGSLAGHIRTSPGTFEKVIDELQEGRRLNRKANQKGLHLTTRQAIQATLATAIASGIGFAISPQRWYWAALASFFVFIGSSRGDTLMRAMYRVVGTAAGLVLGFGFARFITGYHALEWSVIVACVFLGIFGSRLAFGFWTATLFTVMIAILFDLLGQLTNTLLFLRMEETVVGAIIGAIIGSFVLPTSTSATVKKAFARLLRTIGEVMADLPLEALSSRKKYVGRLRDIDYDLQALRLAAAPMAGNVRVMRKGRIPELLHHAAVLTHYVLHFSTMNPAGSEDERAVLKERCRVLSAEFLRQADLLDSGRPAEPSQLKTDANSQRGPLVSPLYVIRRIEQVALELTKKLGAG